jgi:hypothetical protein
VREPGRVEYHWQAKSGEQFGRGSSEFQAVNETVNVENVPPEPGPYSLVFDQGVIDQPGASAREVTVNCGSAP